MSEQTLEYSLPGVLHYLQAEWRKFEREKNEWAIERAELQVKRWTKKKRQTRALLILLLYRLV